MMTTGLFTTRFRSKAVTAILVAVGLPVFPSFCAGANHPKKTDTKKQDQAAMRKEAEALQKSLGPASAKVQMAEHDMQSARAALDAARKDEKDAESEVKDINSRLDEIVKQLEDGQPEDSPYQKAKAAYEEAKTSHAAAIAKVTQSDDYKTAHKRAVDSGGGEAIANLRKEWIDQNPTITKSQANLKATKAEYDAKRNELLQGSSQWTQCSDNLKQAQSRRMAAEDASRKAAAKHVTHSRALADAKRQVAAIESALAKLPDSVKSSGNKGKKRK